MVMNVAVGGGVTNRIKRKWAGVGQNKWEGVEEPGGGHIVRGERKPLKVRCFERKGVAVKEKVNRGIEQDQWMAFRITQREETWKEH